MKDFPESLRNLYNDAKSGKHDKEYALGQIFEGGNDFLFADKKQAEYWYKLAAESGYLSAQEALASLYIKQNNDELALKWSMKCAESGSSLGQFNASVLLLGKPDKVNDGIELLKMAVKQDYPQACSLLGTLHFEGKFVEQNLSKGMKYLRMAASSNDPVALHNLAIAYKKGMGVKEDSQRAAAYFELAKGAEFSKSYPQLEKGAVLGNEFIKHSPS